MDASGSPTLFWMWPPATNKRPSGKNRWPLQKTSKPGGDNEVTVLLAGSQTRGSLPLTPPSPGHIINLPLGRRWACTGKNGKLGPSCHWPVTDGVAAEALV